MQLTDEQIMHHFEMCEDPDGARCMECLYESENNIDCFQKLRHDVVCVYNRQKAEIDRLKTEPYQFADIGKTHSKVKSEAIKEFAERLRRTIIDTPFGVNCSGESEDYKDGCLHGLVAKQHGILDVLDNLVKEMVGDF